MRNNNLIGTGVALVTPFNDDCSIDFTSLDKLIKTGSRIAIRISEKV